MSELAGEVCGRHNSRRELRNTAVTASFLQSTLSDFRPADWLQQYQSWWEKEGQDISDLTDRGGTPPLRMFDLSGTRVDQILYSPEYWRMLKHGYQTGLVWRVSEEKCSFSLSTFVPLLKQSLLRLEE